MSGAGKKDMAERTCIVTRSVLKPKKMIRFVAGPEGKVVPDLKGNLPGRGVWVTANRVFVDEAVAKKAFARGLKMQVRADDDLGEQVDHLLAQSALGALGFARKAGECTTGSGKVEAALAKGKVLAVLHASDAAPDGVRKLASSIRAAQTNSGQTMRVWNGFSSMQMDLALGATNVIHAALKRGGAASNCLRRIARLAAYRENAIQQVAPSNRPQGPEGKDVYE